jgi:hypothetical protein
VIGSRASGALDEGDAGGLLTSAGKGGRLAAWFSIAVTLTAAWVADNIGLDAKGEGPFPVDFGIVLVWAAVGSVAAALLTALPYLQKKFPVVDAKVHFWRRALIGVNMVFVTGVTSATGGIRGPFWLLYIPPGDLRRRVVLRPAGARLRHRRLARRALRQLGRQHRARARRPADPRRPIFPAIAWFNASLSNAVWAQQRKANHERDEMQQPRESSPSTWSAPPTATSRSTSSRSSTTAR